MPFHRQEKTRDFTVMPNRHLRDTSLSLKAKGLFSLILSLPDNWTFHVRGLCGLAGQGEDCVRGALRELEGAGYITREYPRRADGRMGKAEYHIWENPPGRADADTQPQNDGKDIFLQERAAGEGSAGKNACREKPPEEAPHGKKPPGEKPPREKAGGGKPPGETPRTEKPRAENPHGENPALLNTEVPSTEIPSTEVSSTEIAGSSIVHQKHGCDIHPSIDGRGDAPIRETEKKAKGWRDARDGYVLRQPGDEDVERVRRRIRADIEYAVLAPQYGARLDDVVALLEEALTSRKRYIHVAGENMPANFVRERLSSLRSSHIQYVLDCMEKAGRVYNIKSYLLTALYNAPATMESYYKMMAAVRMEGFCGFPGFGEGGEA